MSRIGIAGAHSTGKTTLLHEMKRLPHLIGYQVCDEVTRWVKQLGYDINEAGSDVTQELIMMRHIHNFWLYDNMITDRTTLDGYVYSKYLFNHGRIGDVVYQKVTDIFLKSVDFHVYDIVYYLVPEFPIVDDQVRSTSKDFQKEIYDLFEEVIDLHNLKKNFNLTQLTGSIENRVSEVIKTIGK